MAYRKRKPVNYAIYYNMSLIEEYMARERIRETMNRDLAVKVESMSEDDHFFIVKGTLPAPSYWVDSITVQAWMKCGLLKSPAKS